MREIFKTFEFLDIIGKKRLKNLRQILKFLRTQAQIETKMLNNLPNMMSF